MANALSFLTDPEYWRSVRDTAGNSLRNFSLGQVAGVVGAPVDIANTVLSPIGLGSDRPVLGSNYLGDLLGADRQSPSYKIGEFLPSDPTDLLRYGAVAAAPLSALLATKVGSMASDGAKLSDLARAMPNQRGIIAYHGSPHKFDKFDMSKIGTGEGAQAYGHGLYFAESPIVADEYAGKLSDAFAYLGNKKIDHPSVMNALKTTQYGSKGDAARNALDNLARFHPEEAKAIGYVDRFKTPIDIRDAGNFYKVDIPDEAIPKMLDWDKPMSEQSEYVRNALRTIGIDAVNHPSTGGGLLAELKGQPGIEDMPWMGMGEEGLKKAGITGIRYKDGMSRGTDAGTSNFVLFDDQLPRILEVNGKPANRLSDLIVRKDGGTAMSVPDVEKIFHGTSKKAANAIEKSGFDISKAADGSIWFTSNPNIGEVAASQKGAIIERALPKDMKLGGWAEMDKYSTDELINMGYDGLRLEDEGEITYQIFNPQKLKK